MTFKQKLSKYLECQLYFRDYTILPRNRFGKVNKIAVHQIVDQDSMEYDVNNALLDFHRDGFGNIVFYI